VLRGDDAIALLDGGSSDCLGEMTLPGAGRISYMVPIVFKRSRCTTDGIRCVGSAYTCGGGREIGMASASSAVCPMVHSGHMGNSSFRGP